MKTFSEVLKSFVAESLTNHGASDIFVAGSQVIFADNKGISYVEVARVQNAWVFTSSLGKSKSVCHMLIMRWLQTNAMFPGTLLAGIDSVLADIEPDVMVRKLDFAEAC